MMTMMMMLTMQQTNPSRDASLNPLLTQMMATWNNATPTTSATTVQVQSPSGEMTIDTEDDQVKNVEN